MNRNLTLFLLSAVLACTVSAKITHENLESVFPEPFSSGLIPLDDKDDIFYWHFPSRASPDKDPLVFWLSGGPGCSSGLAALFENGPYHIVEGELVINKNSWNNKANLVFVDQPVGTGFSKGKVLKMPHNEDQIAEQFGVFLKGFYEKYQEYKDRPFYITGESYAGHYIPFIGNYILTHKDEYEALGVNLQGVAIGNGWVDPYNQYAGYAQFSYDHKLVNDTGRVLLEVGFRICQILVSNNIPVLDMYVCNILMEAVLGNPMAPRFNIYDVRRQCDDPPLCYDFSDLDIFFNRKDVRRELGVEGRKWQACNMIVHFVLLLDFENNAAPHVTDLLNAGVNVLVYNGDQDYICNWRGSSIWTDALEWEKAEDYRKAETKEISTGTYKAHGNFAFYRIYGAGHMVPMDQPEAALQMINHFIGQDELE